MTETHDHGPVNFDVLVGHYCDAYQGGGDRDRTHEQDEFRRILAGFEKREGRIKSSFWCGKIRAGAVLTEKDRLFSAGDPYRSQVDLPLARSIGRADAFARTAEELLPPGVARRTALGLVYAIETNALACMDELESIPPAASAKAAALRSVTVAKIRDDLEIAKDYLEGAMGRRARLVYLQGMLIGVGVLAAILALIALVAFQFSPRFVDGTELVPTTLLFGGLGAVVSVMQRLTQGDLRVRLEPGETTVRLLGAFRPIIGGVLAVAILALVLGGLIPLSAPTDPAQRAFFFAGLAFLSGFSERYAQDMLGAGKAATISPREAPANPLGPVPAD